MSKLINLFFCACLTWGSLGAAGKHPVGIHDLLAMERLAEPRVSPDGRRVAFTVSVTDLPANTRHTSLWIASVDGSSAHPVDQGGPVDGQPRWSPDGRTIYFLSSRSGSSQVWRVPVEGGPAEQVTRLPLDLGALELSPDGRWLLVSMAVFPGASPQESKARLEAQAKQGSSAMVFDRLMVRHWDAWENGTRNHLFAFNLVTGQARDLMPAMDADCPSRPFGGLEEAAISPDGARVVFSAKAEGRAEAWSTRADLYEVPMDGSSAPHRITDHPAMTTQPRFSPDGRQLAYLAMSRPGFESDRLDLILRDLASGRERRFILKADPSPNGDRSPGELNWSADGRELYCTAFHLGQRALFAIDAASGRARILVGQGSVSQPRVAGDRILFALNTLQGPDELHTVGRDGKGLARITHLNDARVAAARWGEPESFRFPGAKGDNVHGYLVKPVDFDPSKRYPVALLIHGGPQDSMGNEFHYRWNPQPYAGAGYAVLMIDFHGSVGYGQTFTDAIRGDWGGAPFEDLMKGLDFAIKRYPFLDGERIGALGASYGGFMINWIAGHTDRFKTLVCHDGNLDERFAYFATEELWFPEWEHKGTPWDNPAGYARFNPIESVDHWKTPMLVIHGEKDYRVVSTQGLATFTALQRRGVPSRLIVFPDENHWVLKPANSLFWHQSVIAWLDQWLKR